MSESSTPAGRVTLADLEGDPHRVLARLRAAAPAAWVPVLGTWLVTGYDLAVAVLRDGLRTQAAGQRQPGRPR